MTPQTLTTESPATNRSQAARQQASLRRTQRTDRAMLTRTVLRGLTLVLAMASAACGNCDTRGAEPIEFNGGNQLSALDYETGPLFGEYLHFIPGRRFDIMHHLGVLPDEILSYVSFAREPAALSNDEENTGNIAEAAGNQVVIECADAERVRVRNDTCAEFYLRVKVSAANPDATEIDRPCR